MAEEVVLHKEENGVEDSDEHDEVCRMCRDEEAAERKPRVSAPTFQNVGYDIARSDATREEYRKPGTWMHDALDVRDR